MSPYSHERNAHVRKICCVKRKRTQAGYPGRPADASEPPARPAHRNPRAWPRRVERTLIASLIDTSIARGPTESFSTASRFFAAMNPPSTGPPKK
jgi:hypothetical protein